MLGRRMVLKDVYILVSKICENVILCRREIKVADEIKVNHQVTINRENTLDYLCGHNVIIRALKSGRVIMKREPEGQQLVVNLT